MQSLTDAEQIREALKNPRSKSDGGFPPSQMSQQAGFPLVPMARGVSVIREQQERQAKSLLGNESSALTIAQSLGIAQIDVATLLGNVGNDNLPH